MIKTYKEYVEGAKPPSTVLKKKEKETVSPQEVIMQYVFRWPEITISGWYPDNYKVEIDGKIIELDIINGIIRTTDKRIKDYLLKREFELLEEKRLEEEN